MPRALTSLVVAVAVALTASGCSGGDEPSVVPSSTSSATSSPTATSTSPGAAVDPTAGLIDLYVGDSTDPQEQQDARCFAVRLQDALDPSELTAAGILGADGEVADALPVFDTATAEVWVEAQLGCVDYVEASTRALVTQTRGALDPEAYAACLRDALTETELRAALVQTLSGGFDSPEVAALADAQSTCAG